MPLVKRLSSKFHSCPRSFASRPTVHFSDNLSTAANILQYTSRLKGFYLLNEQENEDIDSGDDDDSEEKDANKEQEKELEVYT